MDSKKIIYIAGPYSNNAPADVKLNASMEKRVARFNAVTEVARCLIEKGELIYSPLTMTHPIDIRMKQDPGSAFWVTFDEAFMKHCGRILVLKLPGWNESSGVKREIEFFKSKRIKIEWAEPSEYGITANHPDFANAFI
jgi:Domain of unknown function (DUF1937)